MRKVCFLVVMVLQMGNALVAQDDTSCVFSSDVLLNPTEYSAWFDNNFKHQFVDEYNILPAKTFILSNGYAQHRLSKSAKLINNSFLVPTLVEVVFTNYPVDKHRWRTNYYELIANRIREILALDSTLNSPDVNWQFVLQTKGKTEPQAQEMFHGIVVHYKNAIPRPLAQLEFTPEKKCFAEFVINLDLEFSSNRNELLSDSELQSILYPQSVFNHNMKQQIPTRTKRPNEPGCSKFTTRADKPRVSLFRRLFR